MQTQVRIFESSQLKGSYVGDSMYYMEWPEQPNLQRQKIVVVSSYCVFGKKGEEMGSGY